MPLTKAVWSSAVNAAESKTSTGRCSPHLNPHPGDRLKNNVVTVAVTVAVRAGLRLDRQVAEAEEISVPMIGIQ